MKRVFAIALLVPALACAEVTPAKGQFDPRVRIMDYNPLNVVQLTTFYGVSTDVQFGDGEVIRDVATGDDQAWKIVRSGSHLFIKPVGEKADTNLTVVTDRRVYHFALRVAPRKIQDETAWRDPDLIFALAFRYPEEEATKRAAKRAAQEKAENLTARLGDMKAKLADAKKEGQNYDYWVAGTPEISPTAARDDGRFTYLTFSNNRDMPAVYAVDAEGQEALVNTNVDGNTIIVHRVLPRLTLRKGNAVACLVNKGFDLDGGTDNKTGTIAPDVERVIKGAQ